MTVKLVWDLTKIFKDDDEFYQNIEKLKERIKELKQKKSLMNENNILEFLEEKWLIKEYANNILIYGSLHYYQDVNSKRALEMKKKGEQLNDEINLDLDFIEEMILKMKMETLMESPKFLKYKFYLDNRFRLKDYFQKGITNRKIIEYSAKINAQLVNYNKINNNLDFGTIFIEEKEIKLNLANISQYLSSKEREIRKQAYNSFKKTYWQKEEELANILKNIYQFRFEICKLEKYNSLLEKALFNENIDVDVIENLIKSVNDNLPLMQKYLSLKTKSLGLSKTYLYDYSVSFGKEMERDFPLEEGIEIIREALKPLGKTYLSIVDELLEQGHIDALLNKNKHQSITFSWGLYSFLNYKNRYLDLKNLIHELGHLVNTYLSKKHQPYIYEDSTVFIGEIGSLVNEILLNRYLLMKASNDEERLYYLSMNIENFITQVFKQTMFTEFEQNLSFHLLQGRKLETDIFNNEYGMLITKYYGKEFSDDEGAKRGWACLGHLYRWSYYVYQYATGFLIANYIVNSLVLEKKLDNKKYLDFLSKGKSNYSLELLKEIGIDLTSYEILKKGFKGFELDVDYFSKVLSKE